MRVTSIGWFSNLLFLCKNRRLYSLNTEIQIFRLSTEDNPYPSNRVRVVNFTVSSTHVL